jgi:hypothetical protein
LAQRIVSGHDGVSRVPVGAMIRTAIAAKAIRSRTPERLSLWDIILERLAQDIEDMAAALRPFIQKEPAMIGARHIARESARGHPRSTQHQRSRGAWPEMAGS